MEGFWGMGSTVSSYSTAQRLQVGSPGGPGRREGEKPEAMLRRALADRIEDKLGELLARAAAILTENRAEVLALAHALETYRTLTGDDVKAVIEGREGDTVDGSAYRDPEFAARLEDYHSAAVGAHRGHSRMPLALPPGRSTVDGTAAEGTAAAVG
jgi:hypothetical protein